jgi:heme O synthase-like polyprenyltransferase
MVATTYILSSFLMAVVLLAVGFATTRSRTWRQYAPASEQDGSPVLALLKQPATWTWGFVVIVIATLASALAYLNGVAVGQSVLVSLLGGLVVCYLAVGIYYAAKSRGHPHAYAIAESVVALAALLLLAIVSQLVA